ncbi:MAG TPA: signal recognition particle protein [Hellea balneolensis]|uniref:Signal recognition particle protein n=1 Tax=Hellea balneolensis TaxID=287478 RepID=A0A7V5U197_9PROT|nr:signal recognition particle protein [Hellea balneolensis]
MFEALSDRLGGVFDKLTGRGALSEKDVSAAMREIRVALLEADVALPVVKDFIEQVRAQAVGEKVIRAVKPGEQIVKIVHDALVEVLGGKMEEGEEPPASSRLNLSTRPPAVILMAGLQGSGKTTTSGKLALYLKKKLKKKVLLASLDTRRPAAMEQLGILAEQAGVGFLPIVPGEDVLTITKRALKEARLGGYDVLFLDTAGRTTIDDVLMDEVSAVAKEARPVETLLVADSLTGQDAVETARRFHERLPLTGLVLTRIDGDGRGGAALSMRAVTGLPIKFLGTGEKLDGLEVFDPERLAGRILGRGDIVALVEKAAEVIDEKEAKRLQKKMEKGKFDLDDLAKQLGQINKMGGMGGLMKLMPGMGKMRKAMDQMGGLDNRLLARQQAIIYSMTPWERAHPKLIKASRKKRIAAGSGVTVAEVNKLLKMHRGMADMMKKMGKGGMRGLMKGFGAGPDGLPEMDPSMMEEMQKKMGGELPRGLPGLGGKGPGGKGGLPGLGGGLPGLGGGNPFGKKK